MAEQNPHALTSWRRVADVDGVTIAIRYDCGDWVLESRRNGPKGFVVKDLDVSPAAMDAIVAAWPGLKGRMP